MDTVVGIGEFSKMSYLSVKALRHYHDVGLLEPAAVDPATGYRRYTTSQVPVAHAIRRFRDLDMAIDEIRLVLQAPDAGAGNRAILRHLERMQDQLEQTQQTVAALQSLLSGTGENTRTAHIRHLPRADVLARTAVVLFDECASWLDSTLHTLRGRADAAGLSVAGPDGAFYADAFFEAGEGEVTAFVPIETAPIETAPIETARTAGATASDNTDIVVLAAQTVALLLHEGPLDDIDRTYGALGTIVAERGIGGAGPIREHYLDETRTEVCWPVASAAPGAEASG
jgi:DNA-binding transcriptional MerR regulator